MQNNFNTTLPPKTLPTIELENCILREKKESDTEDFLAYYSNPDVNQYILATPPYDFESARRELMYYKSYFQYNQGAYFAIADKETDKMIGVIGVMNLNHLHNRCEISYDLDQNYWKKGIMTNAVKAVCDFAIENFKIHRIEAVILKENIASDKLLTKCGFTLEGRIRDYKYFKGKYYDIQLYSKINV